MAMYVIGFQVRNIPPTSFFILARFETRIIFAQSLHLLPIFLHIDASVSVVLHCHAANAKETVSFSMRSDVALGSAKGILYLHTEANPPVIHRDIKTSKILLDCQLHAKLLILDCHVWLLLLGT